MSLKTINYKKEKYILCDDVMKQAPIYSKGARNTRSLIKNKNINEDMYLFFKQKEDGKWTIADGKSIKYDKVFLKKDILNSIPELSGADNAEITDDKGISKAPPIIELVDDEKFKDDEGNIVEIETRGTRNYDGVFFKVKDIEKGFELYNLQSTIRHKGDTNYELLKDYQFFIYEQENGKIKKETFLTYSGFRKMIEVSRINFSEKTKYTLHKWLSQLFDNKLFDSFSIDIQRDVLKSKIGYVYCISSPCTNTVKIVGNHA